MINWVDVRNFNELMSDYQKSSYDSTIMPELATYLKQIIDQNQQIISLLSKLGKK